ncbi:MAG: hypothetical protein C4K58_07570 [Flavobacteriaceae bacterium]|nr:MAG: hypothetical protein C4K58_07570 [Flavobacteriaceae bacterium]
MKPKNILLLSPTVFGYLDQIHSELIHQGVQSTMVHYHGYKYKGFVEKVQNFFSKTFLDKNLKYKRSFQTMYDQIPSEKVYDCILLINPEYYNKEDLLKLKSRTKKLITYLFDGVEKVPDSIKHIEVFDKVFCYDKSDVQKYGFQFITNYIYHKPLENSTQKHLFFNIASFDKSRFEVLKRITDHLDQNHWDYNFMLYHPKEVSYSQIKWIHNPIDVKEIQNFIASSKILLDIQREKQTGLSFRVFEALGNEKKLVTTNPDISSYDFYHPQNICIIDPKNPVIPKDFVASEYQKISEEILQKYRLSKWVKKVFDL